MPSADCFVFCDRDGLVEPCIDLGDRVTAGDPIARVHPVDRTGEAPTIHRAQLDGILTSRHFPGLAKAGDCLAVIAVPAG
jgi:N-alpha-acetyl-L-2,4-diaminobutyrate deacetylase